MSRRRRRFFLGDWKKGKRRNNKQSRIVGRNHPKLATYIWMTKHYIIHNNLLKRIIIKWQIQCHLRDINLVMNEQNLYTMWWQLSLQIVSEFVLQLTLWKYNKQSQKLVKTKSIWTSTKVTIINSNEVFEQCSCRIPSITKLVQLVMFTLLDLLTQ